MRYPRSTSRVYHIIKSIEQETDVSLLQSLAQVKELELFTLPDITTQYKSLDNCLNDNVEL